MTRYRRRPGRVNWSTVRTLVAVFAAPVAITAAVAPVTALGWLVGYVCTAFVMLWAGIGLARGMGR